MSASSPTPAPPSATASVEVLKRIKSTESEWAQKLATAREEAAVGLARLRTESDTAIREAQQAADDRRAQSVATARLDIEREVGQILDAGRKDAEAAGRSAGKRPSDRRDAVLAAVLGPFVRS